MRLLPRENRETAPDAACSVEWALCREIVFLSLPRTALGYLPETADAILMVFPSNSPTI